MLNNLKMLNNVTKLLLGDAIAVKADSSQIPRLTVESMNNHVYFYADVDTDRCLALIRSLRDLDVSLRNERLTRGIPESYPSTPIWLHINSDGGDLLTGFAMADQIKSFSTPIHSVVEGVCASAATLISMACTRRYMLPRSFMLFHPLSALAWGKYQEIKDEVVLLDMAMGQLKDFYATHSKLSAEKIEDMLKHDTWLNAPQCLENGMIDEIDNVK